MYVFDSNRQRECREGALAELRMRIEECSSGGDFFSDSLFEANNQCVGQ